MEILRDLAAEISNSAPSRNDMTNEGVCFLGLRFDAGSIEQAACDILAEVRERFKYIVTPNVHHMVRMLEDPDTLQPLYEGAWRVFCDSRVLTAWPGRVVLGFQLLQVVILPRISSYVQRRTASRLRSLVRHRRPALDCRTSILGSMPCPTAPGWDL